MGGILPLLYGPGDGGKCGELRQVRQARYGVPALLVLHAQEMGRLHPDTFTAQPSPKELDGLKVGDVVKICVPDPGERLWCIINAVRSESMCLFNSRNT